MAEVLVPGQAGWEGLSSDQRQQSSGAVTLPLIQGVATEWTAGPQQGSPGPPRQLGHGGNITASAFRFTF